MIPGLIQPGQIFSPGATLNFSLPTTPSTSRTRPRARAAADIKPDLFGKHALIGAKVEAERGGLAAARDVLLTAAANTAEVQGKSSGSSFGGGVTFSFGGTQNGLSFQLNASRMQGKKNGHETVWDNTLVTATESLRVTSGRDTALTGAQVAGKSVLFDVGGQPLIESLQDRTHYEDKQRSSGFSISARRPWR